MTGYPDQVPAGSGVTVSDYQREKLLRYAASLTGESDRANPVLVGQAALPLLEWAEKAPTARDLTARMRALTLQHYNARAATVTSSDPAAFVEAAKVHYDFLSPGLGEEAR